MTVRSIYPVLMTDSVTETAAFYCDYFGFEKTFGENWYVSLRHREPPHHELAILQFDHPSVPDGHRVRSRGVLINVEVADARELHRRLIGECKLPVHLSLRDEQWGQRHFITSDPSGNLIDVIENIEPSEAFRESFSSALT